MPQIIDKIWDTNFFGFKTGEIFYSGDITGLTTLLNNAQLTGYKLLYWKIPSDHKNENLLAEQAGLFKGDTKIVYQLPALKKTNPDVEPSIKMWEGIPTDQLLDLGILSGEYSRFHRDPKIPTNVFAEMYKEWVTQSVNGKMGDAIYYFGDEKEISAFVSIKLYSLYAEIGLIAVAKKFQRRNLATSLIWFTQHLAFLNNLPYVQVATQQQNIPANRLYQKCGGTIISSENIYHIWL